MLSEKRQSWRSIYYMIILIWHSWNDKITMIENNSGIAWTSILSAVVVTWIYTCERNIHILCVYILHILICVYIIYVCVSMLTSWLYNWTILSKEKEGRRKTGQAVQKMCKIQERRITDEISYWRNQRGISSRAQIKEGKTLPETHKRRKVIRWRKGTKTKIQNNGQTLWFGKRYLEVVESVQKHKEENNIHQ